MTGKLDHSEKAKGSKGTHDSVCSIVRSQSEFKPEINQTDYHYNAVKNVEFVASIVSQTQSNHFSDHLSKEDPNENMVEYLQNISLIIALVIPIERQSDCIRQYKTIDEEVEGHWCHNFVEKAVETVFLRPFFCVELQKILLICNGRDVTHSRLIVGYRYFCVFHETLLSTNLLQRRMVPWWTNVWFWAFSISFNYLKKLFTIIHLFFDIIGRGSLHFGFLNAVT